MRGEKLSAILQKVLIADHPRLRGEKQKIYGVFERRSGSPPLARGKAEDVPAAANGNGITPACAGKSLAKLAVADLTQDHPRLRGEKADVAPVVHGKDGSPPLARGKGGV